MEIKNVKLGSSQISRIYCGWDLIFSHTVDNTAPITSLRPYDPVKNPNNAYASGVTVWFDVNEPCDTYYTLDGSTPTISPAHLYTGDGVWIDETTTIKYFSIDDDGNREATKTVTYTIVGGNTPTTTISPSNTTQYNIPITVTLSTDEAGATIYYKLGTGSQKTYTAPFKVSQDSAGVYSTQIKVTYWAVGANGTEAEKTITYDTSGSVPDKPTVTATAGNWYVRLDWPKTANTTSYNVYRSTVAGELGEMVSQYQTNNYYDDTTAQNGTTYYYTVRAANYARVNSSDQVSATPSKPVAAGWRYLRITPDSLNGNWQANEMRIFDKNFVNIAPTATATFTPAPDWSNTFGDWSLMVDGDTTTSTIFYGWGYPLQIDIDLGEIKEIQQLDIFLGTSTTNPTQAVDIRVSKDGTNWVIGKASYTGNPLTNLQRYTISS